MMIENVDANEFTRTVRKLVHDHTEKLYSRTFRQAIIDDIQSDNVADLLVEGNATPTNGVQCVASYTPRPGDKVWMLSAGQTGADLTVLGPVGPPIGQWINVSGFVNNWQNVGSPYLNAQYSRDSQGFVHLRGNIQRTVNGTAVAFTLPAAYRPAYNQTFAIMRGFSSGAEGTTSEPIALRIYKNGDVEPAIGGGHTSNAQRRVVLAGVHYRAGGS